MAARSKKGCLINSEGRKQRTAQCSSIHLRTQFNAPSLRESTNRDNVAMSGEAGAAKNASPSREATSGSFSNREGLVRSITVLRGHSNERVQKLRSEVGTVWPCHCVQIRMHLKRTKRLHIPKGLKNWTSHVGDFRDHVVCR